MNLNTYKSNNLSELKAQLHIIEIAHEFRVFFLRCTKTRTSAHLVPQLLHSFCGLRSFRIVCPEKSDTT